MGTNIKVYWSGHDEDEAKNVLKKEHPEKMMIQMKDGLCIITAVEDFKKIFIRREKD